MLQAQDPNFSQFMASPLSISPALTGHCESKLRIMTNARSQWIGLGSTYNTETISVDGKVNSINDDNYFLSLGGMLIQDKAMDGIFKSTYAIM